MASTPFSTESYFQTQKPPAGLDERVARVKAFVDKWKEVEGKRVVLITVSWLFRRPILRADSVEWGNNRSTRSQHVRPNLTSIAILMKQSTIPRQLFSWYKRSDFGRILPISRLRSNLPTPYPLPPTFLTTLLPLSQSFLGPTHHLVRL